MIFELEGNDVIKRQNVEITETMIGIYCVVRNHDLKNEICLLMTVCLNYYS